MNESKKTNKPTRDEQKRSLYGIRISGISIGVNLMLFVLKIVMATLTGSISLMADAIHTLSDMATSAIIMISFFVTKKPSDSHHPFGHGRMESVATLIVAVLLGVAGVEILKGSIERLIHPIPFKASWTVIALIAATVIVKELLALYSSHAGKKIDSESLMADSLHHRTDAISSLLVIAAFIGQRYRINYLDSTAGILVALFIVYTGFKISLRVINDLIGTQPSEKLVNEIKSTVMKFKQVNGIHDLIIHQYGQNRVLSFHIAVSDDLSLKQTHILGERIEKLVNQKFHTHSTIHFDPIDLKDPISIRLNLFVSDLLKKEGGSSSFHDLRIFNKEDGHLLTFDLVPYLRMNQEEVDNLKNRIKRNILKTFPSIKEITIEIEPKYSL